MKTMAAPCFVRRLEDVLVLDRSARLDRRGRPGVERVDEPVGEGEHGVARDDRALQAQACLLGLPGRDAAGIDSRHLPGAVARVRSLVVKTIALDFTCFTMRQPKRIASISSAVGGRWVTTFFSMSSSPSARVSWSITRSPPGAEWITGSSSVSRKDSFIWMRRRFFFFWSRARASLSNSGAMITSVKISEMTRASPMPRGRLQTMTPPKGAWRSVSKAFSQARRRSFSSAPTPQGLVCFRIRDGGTAEFEDQFPGRGDVEHVRVAELLPWSCLKWSVKLP